MPTPIRQLNSQTHYAADGTTTVWPFSFTGGYIDKSHVKARTKSPTGDLTDIVIDVNAHFPGAYQLLVFPAVAVGYEIQISRQTPNGEPLVDFEDGSQLPEANLDLLARQAIFVAAEAYDAFNLGYAVVGDVIDYVNDAVDAAAAAAVSQAAANADAADAYASRLAAAASAASVAAQGAAVTSLQALLYSPSAGEATLRGSLGGFLQIEGSNATAAVRTNARTVIFAGPYAGWTSTGYGIAASVVSGARFAGYNSAYPGTPGGHTLIGGDGGSDYVGVRGSVNVAYNVTSYGSFSSSGPFYAPAFNIVSDARLKSVHGPAEDAGELLDAIDVVSFTRTDTGKQYDYGFLAQQLAGPAPFAVTPGDDVTPWAVDNSALVPALLLEIQSLRRRVEALEGR